MRHTHVRPGGIGRGEQALIENSSHDVWGIPWDIRWDTPWDIPWDTPWDIPWDIPWDVPWDVPWDIPKRSKAGFRRILDRFE